MSDVSSVTKHFAKPQEGFTTTLASTISAGATTVPMNSTTGLTNGDVFVGIMDPGATAEQVFTGTVDTSGVQITSVVWTKGTNTTHNAGTTIVDYTTASAFSMMSKGILVHSDQDGTLKADSVDTAAITDAAVTSDKLSAGVKTGWNDVPGTTSYNQNNGARSTDIDVDSDITASVDEGMRVRMTRGTTPPTQSYDFDVSESQYASKSSPTGFTFTDDFTCEAWVKETAFSSGVSQAIVTRFNGTDGWQFFIKDGKIGISGFNGGGGNYGQMLSDGGVVPTGEWTHIAATLNMDSDTGTIYVNGALVDSTWEDGGTNPTALVQPTADLVVGARNGSLYMNGLLAMVRVWSDIRTQDEIQDNMSIETPASTTGLVDQWSLDGDLTSWSGSNTLTAQGGAAAATDNPFNSVEYGIITGVSESGGTTTLTVDSNTGPYVIPNDTLSSVQYSSHATPYGAKRIGWSQIQGMDSKFEGEWRDWEPTLTNLTLGNGTMIARYTQIGKTVKGFWQITWGSSTSATAGGWQMSLPVTERNGLTVAIGAARGRDNSTGNKLNANFFLVNSTTFSISFNSSVTNIGSASNIAPWTWAVDDYCGGYFEYEAA